MEPEGSLPRSQEPAICLCPKSNEPIPRPHIISFKSILILCHLRLGLPNGLFLPPRTPLFDILDSFVADILYIWPSDKQCHAGCLITVLSECTDPLWGHDKCTGAFGHCFRPRAVLYGQAECENGFRCAVCRSAGQFARYISDLIGWLCVIK
jgi:hypothetical protein